MTRQEILDELAQLSAAERMLLAQDLWESVAEDPSAWELTSEQRDLLDRRLAAFRKRQDQGRSAGATWDEVKSRIQRQP
jgi:putative addiction module component (TIGR02574 family)